MVRLHWRILTFFTVCLAMFVALASVSEAVVRVRGYTRKDGTYVRPHYRSNPDGNFNNNWTTKGNVNPYTGVYGTRTRRPPGYGVNSTYGNYSSSYSSYSPEYLAPDTWGSQKRQLRAQKLSEKERRKEERIAKRIADASIRATKPKKQVSSLPPVRKPTDALPDLPPLVNRKWISSNGRYSEVGILESVSSSNVVRLLRVSDGKKLTISMDNLSHKDQEYVKGIMEEAGDAMRPIEELFASQTSFSR